MNLYLAAILAWCVFTGTFGIYNTLTPWPRSRRHKRMALAWAAWSAVMLAVTIFHFHS